MNHFIRIGFVFETPENATRDQIETAMLRAYFSAMNEKKDEMVEAFYSEEVAYHLIEEATK